MKSYKGRRIPGKCAVTKSNGQMLKMRLDIVNHSPTGPEWGYDGSGPAQLALAILMDFFGDDKRQMVEEVYQSFKRDVIAKLPKGTWEITDQAIIGWYKSFLKEEMATRCPRCGARDTLCVTNYCVEGAFTPIKLVFNSVTHTPVDYEMSRLDGAPNNEQCFCDACGSDMSIEDVMDGYQ